MQTTEFMKICNFLTLAQDNLLMKIKTYFPQKPQGHFQPILYVDWLVDLILNVPVNNFSVMLGRSHHFLGITSTFGE